MTSALNQIWESFDDTVLLSVRVVSSRLPTEAMDVLASLPIALFDLSGAELVFSDVMVGEGWGVGCLTVALMPD